MWVDTTAAQRPSSSEPLEEADAQRKLEKRGLTEMILSESQTFGSYSTTPRSASKATLTEWMPVCVRSILSID